MNGALLTRERVQVPIFARGLVASANGAERAGWVNGTVICGGVIVNPGDIVLADCDGVVFLPQDQADAILRRSEDYARSAATDNRADIPYWQRRETEDKLRALPDIDWS